MVLNLINQEIEKYIAFINSESYNEIDKWEALKTFQDNWNIDATDFKTMYSKSLFSKTANNLWANPHWFPKAVMLRFLDHNPEKVRNMFADLYNETQDVGKRIDRFEFQCDVLLKEIANQDPSVKNHFHNGQRMITLYLAFRFPEKYAIYKFTEFKTFMEKVGAKDIPGTGEYERFFKVVRTIYEILSKNQVLMQEHEKKLTNSCYRGKTLMLAQDFIFTTARRYMG
ncbi:MAG TPA: hypothetical protein PK239_02245 [Chitinophagales bacterium]|nr:hypothetical protein [Chitinophagales bacterium]